MSARPSRLASQRLSENPEFRALGRRFIFRGAPLGDTVGDQARVCDRLSRNLGVLEICRVVVHRSRVRGRRWPVIPLRT